MSNKSNDLKLQSELICEYKRQTEMFVRFLTQSRQSRAVPIKMGKKLVTDTSEIPCRLNDDVHEWWNEIVTVPN